MSECKHENIKLDEFAQLPGVVRVLPGNACCADCGRPLPITLERGRVKEIHQIGYEEPSF